MEKARLYILTHDIKLASMASSVSHLLFVGDLLLLVEATEHWATKINNIMHAYVSVSTQMISTDMPCIMLSANTTMREKNSIMHILGLIQIQTG